MFQWFSPRTTIIFLIVAIMWNILMQLISISPFTTPIVKLKVDFRDITTYFTILGLIALGAVCYRLGEFRLPLPAWLKKLGMTNKKKDNFPVILADTPPEVIRNNVKIFKQLGKAAVKIKDKFLRRKK